MSGYLVDTNVISEIARKAPQQEVVDWLTATPNELLYLSVLTIGEIRRGISAQADSRRRTQIETWLETDLKPWFEGRILPVSVEIAERWGTLSGAADASGKRVSVIDALLASTALHYGLVLVTRNVKDVERAGVQVFSPWP